MVRELYERSRTSLAVFIALVQLFGLAMVRSNQTDRSGRVLFVLLVALTVVRWILVMIPTARRNTIASVPVQMLVFVIGVVLTSSLFAALIVRIWPILDLPYFGILAAVVAGLVSGAIMSLGVSPIVYVLYMAPPLGAMFFMAITDLRPPWGADLLAVAILLYAGMSLVMGFDHARTRRRSIELSLQLSDLVLRDALTQLRNRRFLQEYMTVEQREWRGRQRTSSASRKSSTTTPSLCTCSTWIISSW